MRRYLLFIIITFMALGEVISQTGSFGETNARAISMAGTQNASGYGLLSIGTNPSLLARQFTANNNLTFLLPSLSAKAMTNTFSLDDVNFFFGINDGKRRRISSADKARFIDAFSNDGKLAVASNLNYFSAGFNIDSSIGAVALSVGDYIAGNMFIPGELVQLALNGNDSGRTYSFDNLKAEGWILRYYSLTFARDIQELHGKVFKMLSAGVSIKYFQGFAYSKTEVLNSMLYTGAYNKLTGRLEARTNSSFSPVLNVKYDYDSNYNNTDFSVFPEPAGSGIGIDIGLAAELNNGLRFGISLTDLGSIKWDKNTAVYSSTGNFEIYDLLDQAQLDTLQNAIETTNYPSTGFNTPLPMALRIGAAYELQRVVEKIPGILTLAIDYNQGLNSSPMNTTTPRFSFGAEWMPGKYIPSIATGIGYDQTGNVNWALGIGYSTSFLDFYIGTSDALTLFGIENKMHFSAAACLMWKIF
ncbi:MAG: hypothetical protein QG635_2426 [Bacteroidota bacterium]|nr:hypothetical protein [Bacteroidota bacterium]